MTQSTRPITPTILYDRYRALGLELDPDSGLPRRLLLGEGDGAPAFPFALAATLQLDGDETAGGVNIAAYANTTPLSGFRLAEAIQSPRIDGPDAIYTVITATGDWTLRWEYTVSPLHPRLALRLEVAYTGAAEHGTLRDLWLDADSALVDSTKWQIEIPGNQIRPHLPPDSLQEPVEVSPPGGLRGSSGVVALHQPERPLLFLWWPFSSTEIGRPAVQGSASAVHLSLRTDLAGRLRRGQSIGYGVLYLDLLPESWPTVREQIARWYPRLGLAATPDHADWIASASIFEVQIGFSVFFGNYRYSPYPTVRDLIDDLGRIRGLGYTVLQIMPRQPYPSYNVHDYTDITTSYGAEDDLRELVSICHTFGMRVILDILLHGVMDQEVITLTANNVRSGPFFARLDQARTVTFDERPDARESYLIAWSRHIIDFEPYWFGGSPPRHPLADVHPDWFMRDSSGAIIGIYTKAFDVANPDWQEYFCAATEELVRRLDIDGFRFDAPTYNDLPNWSIQTEQRASYSALGCLTLFDRLRPRLKQLKPSVMLYTEPSGVLFRQSMDITYNYDEQWLITSLFGENLDQQRQRTGVRTGHDLVAWFRDRNALLPPHALIAHHIDSHDTFWWPLPGQKWRREQFGLPTTRALLAIFALSGGAYMTFVGGEEGIEEDVRRVHRLRTGWPAIGHGTADFEAFSSDDQMMYTVARQLGTQTVLVAVNLAATTRQTLCDTDIQRLALDDRSYEVFDLWNDRALTHEGSYQWSLTALQRIPLDVEPFQPRVLLLRPLGA